MGIFCHALRCKKKYVLVDTQEEMLLLDYFPFDVHDWQHNHLKPVANLAPDT